MMLGVVHHIPTQLLVVLVEVGFKEKYGAKLIHSKITLFLFNHNIDSGAPVSRSKAGGIRYIGHGGFKLDNLVACQRGFEVGEADARKTG